MSIYETLHIVTKEDLDALKHVNNVRYVQWVQDVAEQHWLQHTSSEINSNYFWVMINHFIEYKSSAVLYDEIRLKTYVTSAEGITSTRVVEMYNNTINRLIVKSETKWCFMSMDTKRPIRIPKHIIQLFD